jgi:hypothetical protein
MSSAMASPPAMAPRASTDVATGTSFILRTFLLLHSVEASRRSILLFRQKEALKGMMSVGSGVRIRLFGGIRSLIPMKTAENPFQTGP